MTKHIPVNAKQYSSPAGPKQIKTVYVDPNQYPREAGPARPTTYQRVAQNAREVAAAAKMAMGAGARVRQVGHDIGQNPYVKYNAQRSGFTDRPTTRQQQYQNAPVDPNSVMHPGNRIIVMSCNDQTGKCRTIATGVSTTSARQPSQGRRRAPAGAVGGLGGNDPGFF